MMIFSQSMLASAARAVCVTTLLMIVGCASAPIDQIDLMPAPDVYGDGLINPLPENDPVASLPYKGILYATDRRPAGEDDPEHYYANDRGQLVRLGVARVTLGEQTFNWDFARKVSMLKNRSTSRIVLIQAGSMTAIIGTAAALESEFALEPSLRPATDSSWILHTSRETWNGIRAP